MAEIVGENGNILEEVPANKEETVDNVFSTENHTEIAEPTEKEKELLDLVFNLESEKQNLIEKTKSSLSKMQKELEESLTENDKLKKTNTVLEQSLKQTAIGNGAPKSKKDFEDILTKAKTLLFEKTKICKQHEMHIEMLKNQVESIKSVLAVTKEMLNVRNAESEHLNARLESIEIRVKGEKDKQGLLEKKLDITKNMYDSLKKEHETQSSIFKELKTNYELKAALLSAELAKYKPAASVSEDKTDQQN